MQNLTCKFSYKCGGCTELSTPYEDQLKKKRKFVQKCLEQEGIEFPVSTCEGMYYPYKYRNKIHLAITEHKGTTKIGFFEEHSNKVQAVSKCLLFDDWAMKLIELTHEYIESFKIAGYNKETRTGTLRYVVARMLDNAISVTLVATTQNFPGKEIFYKKLKETFKNVSFYLNINRRTDNAVFDEKYFVHKAGSPRLKGSLMGINFELSPNSFYQTNEKIMVKMYTKAIELLNIQDNEKILDLYSGIGITSMLFAKKGADVQSIEVSKSSVTNAIHNIKLNNLQSKIYINLGTCKDVITKLQPPKNCKVFLDPARSGAEIETLQTLIKFEPSLIVYMSCNPESLAGDLKILLESKKYNLTYVQPYDMFPQTKHVEVLACLQRKV